jgi:hypothetical protein
VQSDGSALAPVARRLGASVHVPRIGAGTPDFNWYATERLLRDTLVAAGVPTFMYVNCNRLRRCYRCTVDDSMSLHRRAFAIELLDTTFHATVRATTPAPVAVASASLPALMSRPICRPTILSVDNALQNDPHCTLKLLLLLLLLPPEMLRRRLQRHPPKSPWPSTICRPISLRAPECSWLWASTPPSAIFLVGTLCSTAARYAAVHVECLRVAMLLIMADRNSGRCECRCGDARRRP